MGENKLTTILVALADKIDNLEVLLSLRKYEIEQLEKEKADLKEYVASLEAALVKKEVK